MISVGIKELKSKLSSYIDKVGKNGHIVITEHGREVAMIVPISKERKAIRALIDCKKAQWAGSKPRGIRGIKLKGKPLSETIIEGRL